MANLKPACFMRFLPKNPLGKLGLLATCLLVAGNSMDASTCRSVGIWAATPAGYTRIKQNADLVDTAFLDYWWIDAAGNLVNHDPGWYDPATNPPGPLKALGVTCYGALASGN